MPTAQPLTQDQLAALLGVTTRRLRQIAEESPVPREEKRAALYPCDEAGRWLRSYWSPSGDLDPQQEKARLDKVRREVAEIDLERKRGDVVPVSQVAAEWESLVSTIRANLLSIPSRAAPEVFGLAEEREIEDVLTKAVHAAMEVVASSHEAD